MAVDDLARADALPRVIDWLSAHSAVTAALGGPGRVSAYNEPPYPRLRVIDVPGGSDRELTWLIATSIQIEAYADLSGELGKAELRQILYLALGALAELPRQDSPEGVPVITSVMPGASGAWSPEASGQPRYLATVTVYSHPPA